MEKIVAQSDLWDIQQILMKNCSKLCFEKKYKSEFEFYRKV